MPGNQHSKEFVIDGKPVRKFMFTRLSRVMVNKCIPVDTKERARVLNRDERRFAVIVAVEAFTVDHALERLVEIYPHVKKADWEMQEELDASHDVGMMGTTHRLLHIGEK